MKTPMFTQIFVLSLLVGTATAIASTAIATDGKILFARHCVGCHYNGGNTVNPAKPLTRIYREANGLRTPKELVAKIRQGGPGMPAFSAARLSEPNAQAIAEYIIKTFD